MWVYSKLIQGTAYFLKTDYKFFCTMSHQMSSLCEVCAVMNQISSLREVFAFIHQMSSLRGDNSLHVKTVVSM